MTTNIPELLLRLTFPVAAGGIVWMAASLYGLRQNVAEIRLSSDLKFKVIGEELSEVGVKLDKLDVWMDKINEEFAVVTERQKNIQKHVDTHTGE